MIDAGTTQSAEDPAALIEDAKRLTARLADDPLAVDHIKSIIDEELRSPLTPDSYGSLGRRFTDFIDETAGGLLLSCLTVQDLNAALADAKIDEALEDASLLKRPLSYLRALYRERIYSLQRSWRESPDDWDSVIREINWDPFANAWFYKLTLEKYGGERAVVGGPARSLVGLTARLIDTIVQFPDPSTVEQARLDELTASLESLRTWMATPQAGATGPGAEPAAEPAAPEVAGAPPTEPPAPA